jgi:hypothetical protein
MTRYAALLGVVCLLAACGGGDDQGAGTGAQSSSSTSSGSSSGTSTGTSSTGTATLTWSAPTENTNGSPLSDLAGYTIHYGTNEGALGQMINVPATTTSFEVSNLAPGTYYFEVVAYASDGSQSAPSNIESKTI